MIRPADILRRVLLTAVISVAVLYAGDYLSLKFQLPRRPQFGSVTVQPYYAVPQKNGKTQFMVDQPRDEACVNSLFPHYGDVPCWYLVRHKSQRINL